MCCSRRLQINVHNLRLFYVPENVIHVRVFISYPCHKTQARLKKYNFKLAPGIVTPYQLQQCSQVSPCKKAPHTVTSFTEISSLTTTWVFLVSPFIVPKDPKKCAVGTLTASEQHRQNCGCLQLNWLWMVGTKATIALPPPLQARCMEACLYVRAMYSIG